MFGWFKKSKDEDYSIYSPGERLIFKYFNGKRTVAADPYVLFKKMMNYAPELNVAMKVSVNPLIRPNDAQSAHDEVVEKVRDIFNVTSLEQGGLTELECVQLLNQFLTFCGSVKKNSSSSVTDLPEPLPQKDFPTSQNLDSGSTETDLLINNPG